MKKISAAAAVGLATGIAAAAIVLNTSRTVPESAPSATPAYFDKSAATEDRIRALEAAISEEREARQLLEEELMLLFAEIERLEGSREEMTENREARGRVETSAVERTQQARADRSAAGGRDAMIEAGLTPERVDWILRREEEMRFESMQARFDARNSDEPRNPFDARFNPEAMLRAEIGDADYERYLEANNRPTSARVGNVLASSPGERAGLQPGDQIVGYDGTRVFSSGDLIQQTMQGGEGSVVVDVIRDGAPMQVVLPRGPIGIEIGRFGGR
jgi:TolA-binding protein